MKFKLHGKTKSLYIDIIHFYAQSNAEFISIMLFEISFYNYNSNLEL